MSEENREQVRRRRRSEYTEPREELSAWGTTPAEETDGEQENGNRAEANPEKPEQKPTEERTPENGPDHAGNGDEAEPDQEMPVQAPDSRVPLQARQMSASPYGPAETGNTSGVRRPGTRPVVAVRRLPLRDPEGESAVQTGRMPIRKPGEEQSGESSRQDTRLQVGYAPGRMSEREQAERPVPPQATSRIGDIPQNRVRIPARPLGGSPITAMSMQDRMPRKKKKHTLLWVVPALVLAVVLAVVLIPSLRKTVTGFAGKIFGSSSTPEPQEVSARSILLFKAEGGEGQTAPANVVLTVQADKTIQAIRASSGNNEGPAPYTQESSLIENDDSNLWTLSLHVTGGMNDVVRLEVSLDGENWLETEYSALVNVTAQTVTAETPAPGADQAIQAGVRNDGEDGGAAEDGLTGEEGMEDLSGDEAVPMGQDESDGDVTIVVDGDENPDSGENADSGDNTASGDESVPDGDEAAADATGEDPGDGTDKDASAAAVPAAPEATEQPEATEEPEPTPAPLTAEAGPGANPDLIALTTVYNGSKKVTNYVRPAKELIHMPSGWDYPYTQMGILTFRGNAFRTNAAVGHVESAEGLKELWVADGGSARGASTTYYGYEWPGQPAIIKWSKQVRQASNIDLDKQSVKALREVIIAGVDGVIRFLDLTDGKPTRAGINLGYPMKGTPSIHPGTYPYMSVGQYARKMKVKTGKIGLRQYNLYTQNELTLIDGLDGKLHRALNDVGSFETSALIDRTSDTLITAGSNGLLYLIRLNSEFDWKIGSYKTSPSTVVMASRTKGQKKKKALVAVESSLAMYDRYVFYADMGGILRCVDTNFLTTVWAVDTGDAVMAAVALDLVGTDQLDLYTANMLKNRKKGSAQIRRYDALTGKELWKCEVPVQKDTKNKTDSGFKASPVIGENALKNLVYFTVTGLSDEGRKQLGVKEGAEAALLALDKETGEIRWSRGLSDRSESSPVAVYDEAGNGWIIQASWDGTLLLLDGLTGKEIASLELDGNISASPAVYNEILVIGTTGKGTEHIYGVLIR